MAMSTITINFQNATLTTTTSQILITNGTFALDTTSSLSMAGTISFTSLYITAGAINFNVESGTSFTAAVVTPVHPTSTSNAPTHLARDATLAPIILLWSNCATSRSVSHVITPRQFHAYLGDAHSSPDAMRGPPGRSATLLSAWATRPPG